MFDRFTDPAKRTMSYARQEAFALGHESIDTAHLLLGLLRQEPELAEHALPGISIDAVRREVEARIGKGTHRGAGQMPFTAQAKDVLDTDDRAATLLHLAQACGSSNARRLVATLLTARPLPPFLGELPAAARDAVRRLPVPPSEGLGAHWRPEISAHHWRGLDPESLEMLAQVLEVLSVMAKHFEDAQASLNCATLRASIDAARS